MTPILRVKNWDALYENNRTRGLKAMAWVPVPNKHDGDGYSALVDDPSGAAHLGCWLAALQVASRCVPRGTLVRDNGKPHTAESLARMTRLSKAAFEQAIPRLLAVEWLEISDEQCGEGPQHDAGIPHLNGTTVPDSGTTVPDSGTTVPDSGTTVRRSDYEGKGSELNGSELKTPCSSDNDERSAGALELIPPKPTRTDEIKVWFDTMFWPAYPRKVSKPAALRAARKHGKTAAARAVILDYLKRQLPVLQAQLRADGNFIPYPASWLNQTPWIDPQEETQPTFAMAANPTIARLLALDEQRTKENL